MTATNLPYGVPTGQSCPVQGMNRPKPRCTTVGPIEIGLECEKMTTAIGTDWVDLHGCFCQCCRDDGAEAIEVLDGQSLASSVGRGLSRPICLPPMPFWLFCPARVEQTGSSRPGPRLPSKPSGRFARGRTYPSTLYARFRGQRIDRR